MTAPQIGHQKPEKAVIVIEFEFDRDAATNPILAVVEGLREFFANREPSPVGNIWVGTDEYAARVLAVQPDRVTRPGSKVGR